MALQIRYHIMLPRFENCYEDYKIAIIWIGKMNKQVIIPKRHYLLRNLTLIKQVQVPLTMNYRDEQASHFCLGCVKSC